MNVWDLVVWVGRWRAETKQGGDGTDAEGRNIWTLISGIPLTLVFVELGRVMRKEKSGKGRRTFIVSLNVHAGINEVTDV